MNKIERPVLRYFGGKWNLAPWIIQHFPPHRCYVEPFGGGASVLLRKSISPIEVYSDKVGAVVNFFRILRDQPINLIRALELTPFALGEYHSCIKQEGDDVERARRFFVRSWAGYQGVTGTGRNRGWRRTNERSVAGEFRITVDNLTAVARRLRNVAIDNLDYLEVLKRYDAPDTLFYVDPPYLIDRYPSGGYGIYELSVEEHLLLLRTLSALTGSVVLSGYENRCYINHLKGWRTVHHAAKTTKGVARETLFIKEH